MRRGQGVNEDSEGEKQVSGMGIKACVSPVTYLYSSMHLHLCERKHAAQRGTGSLTMSLLRSFSPLSERMEISGMMVMYHGTDEMAGTHLKPHANTSTCQPHHPDKVPPPLL